MAQDDSTSFTEVTAQGAQVVSKSIEQAANDIWNFQIATVENATITIGTLVVGAVFLVAGVFLSKIISRRVGKRFYGRLHVDRSVQHTLETFTFYALTIIFTLFAMRMANLPITIFTVLGGALAIGIGFGSQNIVNNFISGIILMVERPVKVGDFVEIDGLFGEIVDIGPRSTHINSFGNRIFIVPNSSFLEKNVINWTHLSDKYARLTIQVGIAYGSDTEKARDLLIEAAIKEPRVINDKKRKPIVFFLDFGDNALAMEVNCWVRLDHLQDFKMIQSNIRFTIDKLFREGNIVISFPQRDVHLYQSQPFRVEMIGGPKA